MSFNLLRFIPVVCLSFANIWSATIPRDVPRWKLGTADTAVEIAVSDNKIYLERLFDPEEHWNWTRDPAQMPLPRTVSGVEPDWRYNDATINTTSGTELTLRFTSTQPKLELKSTWRARPGSGPVENWLTIQNNTGGNVTYKQADLLSADLDLVSDGLVTLTRFNKCGVTTPAHIGIAVDQLPPNRTIKSQTRDTNDWVQDESYIPFEVLSVGDTHGLYVGYAWSFCKFSVSTGKNRKAINLKAYLWDDKAFVEQDRAILKIPAVYIGTYRGDLDDCGNQFKQWFWRYKVPASLRGDPNEPLIEYCVPESEAALDEYFSIYDMKEWGGELAKIDIGWLAGISDDTSTWFTDEVADWIADTSKWPHGMDAGAIVHRNAQRLSLYIPDTYKWCDLGSQEGRKSEEEALLSRFDDFGFDYYRSDFFTENNAHFNLGPAKYQGGSFYLSHEGYMEVLDYMMAKRPSFRYEHCSGGGTLKDFDTLQRVSVMTTTDISEPDAHRKAMFSNIYCINPVQLKADLSIQGGPGSADDTSWVRYCLRTGFMGANMASSAGFTPTMAVETRFHWWLYKNYMRPILRGADVYHVLPICNGTDWDGFEFFNLSLGPAGRGALLLFKPSSRSPDSRMLRLRGLDKLKVYTLDFEDRSGLNCRMSGAELMEKGVNVAGMSGDYASEIVWINKDRSVARPPASLAGIAEKRAEGTAVFDAAVANGKSPRHSGFEIGRDGTVVLRNEVRLDMVWIPPGEFAMGSLASDEDSEKWERPQTPVVITKGFWLGKTPVTQAQYRAVTGRSPSYFTDVGTDAPVEQVSWDEAMDFCQKLTMAEREAGRLAAGYKYNLPTEAQWEYACRGGTTGVRYSNDLPRIGWYSGNSADSTHLVGLKEPNGFGLYDMIGNVWQWCLDYWCPENLPGNLVTDPAGVSTLGTLRVFRGGAWQFDSSYCRSAYRYFFARDGRTNFLGFRVALSPTK